MRAAKFGVVALAMVTLLACKRNVEIEVPVFPEAASLSKTCAGDRGAATKRLTIIKSGGLTYIQANFDPCKKGSLGLALEDSSGFDLQGTARGKPAPSMTTSKPLPKNTLPPASSKPLVIWAPQYGEASGDAPWKGSDSVPETLKKQGYNVINAKNLSGAELQAAVAEGAKKNPSGSAIVITNGHGAIETTENDDGTTSSHHTITRTDGEGNSTTLATNNDILQPALKGLGLPPGKVISVVSSCQSGQCAADYNATTPKSTILTSSAADQLSWLPQDRPELMIGKLAAVSDPKSAEFKAADGNGDGTVSTEEFTRHVNGNGDPNAQLASLQVTNVVYQTPEGDADLQNIGARSQVYTQNPQTAGPDVPLIKGGARRAAGTDAPVLDYGQDSLANVLKEAEGTGLPGNIHDNSADVLWQYEASQSIANQQIEASKILSAYDNDPVRADEELSAAGYTPEVVQGALEANNRAAQYDQILSNYGGDESAAFEELQGSGLVSGSSEQPDIFVPGQENYGDNGAGDWGVETPPPRPEPMPDAVPSFEPSSETQIALVATPKMNLTTVKKENVYRPRFLHPRRFKPSQMMISTR